jgi:hypothetical protein
MSNQNIITFGAVTGLVAANITWDYSNVIATGAAVSTTNVTLDELGNGDYPTPRCRPRFGAMSPQRARSGAA